MYKWTSHLRTVAIYQVEACISWIDTYYKDCTNFGSEGCEV